jgi:hypothetical protein
MPCPQRAHHRQTVANDLAARYPLIATRAGTQRRSYKPLREKQAARVKAARRRKIERAGSLRPFCFLFV